MKSALFALGAAGMLAFAASLAPAVAHDDYDRHARDHVEHGDYHEDQAEEHQLAHEEGFESRRDHGAYHRALRREHDEFHDDHADTRHDHYQWRWR